MRNGLSREANKSLQATRDGVPSSAIADCVISPAAVPEFWTLGDSERLS
jgi:hypothetical protein